MAHQGFPVDPAGPLDISQVSADPRSRRRRTLRPDQRALPLAELAGVDAIYAYSFILTNLDVSTPDKAALLAVTMAGWLHQLIATDGVAGHLSGWVPAGQGRDRHVAAPAD